MVYFIDEVIDRWLAEKDDPTKHNPDGQDGSCPSQGELGALCMV